ncbi:hypothetical protein DOY81_008150 [Sarcophaga bullata]|nr:hypothetical protein DOY81_008150 [Sarcophaga bullata]
MMRLLKKLLNASIRLCTEPNPLPVLDKRSVWLVGSGKHCSYRPAVNESKTNATVCLYCYRNDSVSQDTVLFAEGMLGKTPTGGKITTYKELCSLASDLNQPEMITNSCNCQS